MDRMETCDVLLIVGTQLTTGGPRSMVRAAQKSGTIIIRRACGAFGRADARVFLSIIPKKP